MLFFLAGGAALVGAWHYVTWARRAHDVRSYHDAHVPYHPHLSTARLEAYAVYDRWTHGNAVEAMREFSRLYQESFLQDADPYDLADRMHARRIVTSREIHALRLWLPNDLPKERQLIAYAEEIDATMRAAVEEMYQRRDVRGFNPHVGDVPPGVRAANDVWS
jgi:hypothetical protein